MPRAASDDSASVGPVSIDAWRKLRASEAPLLVARFSAQLAHDIGTPLNIITGHASMIAAQALDPAGQQTAARKIVEQANRIAVMLREALAKMALPAAEREVFEVGDLARAAAAINGSGCVVVASKRVRGNYGQLLFALCVLAKENVRVDCNAPEPPRDVAAPKTGFVCVTMNAASQSGWSELAVQAAQRVLKEHGGFLASAGGEHRACLPIEGN